MPVQSETLLSAWRLQLIQRGGQCSYFNVIHVIQERFTDRQEPLSQSCTFYGSERVFMSRLGPVVVIGSQTVLIHQLQIPRPDIHIGKRVRKFGYFPVVIPLEAYDSPRGIADRFGGVVSRVISLRINGPRQLCWIKLCKFISVQPGELKPTYNDIGNSPLQNRKIARQP